MSKFSRSDIKKFIYGTVNHHVLNEEVEVLGNKIDVKDGALIFNDKLFKLNGFKSVFGVEAPIGVDVASVSMDGNFLKIILKHPLTGDDIPIVMKDESKRDKLISLLNGGKDFVYKTVDASGKEKKLGFSVA